MFRCAYYNIGMSIYYSVKKVQCSIKSHNGGVNVKHIISVNNLKEKDGCH